MTTYTTLTVAGQGNANLLPPIEEIAAAFALLTDFSFDRLEDDEQPEWDGDEIVLQYARRRMTKGLDAFAATLSAAHPRIAVTVNEEWEARPNRAHGGREKTWIAGRVARSQRLDWCSELTLATDEGVRFEHWSNGATIGYRLTRERDGRVEYLLLNPGEQTGAGRSTANVHVTADPASELGEAVGRIALFADAE
jgi:hypothetical protein